MFGFLQSPENEPLELEVKAIIAGSAEKIFELLDFSSPRSRLKLRGFEFSKTSDGFGDYVAVDPNMPDLTFHFSVHDYQPSSNLSYSSHIECDELFGALEKEYSEIVITPIDKINSKCRVEIKTTAWFQDGLSRRTRRTEDEMMTQAVSNNLIRLKSEVEDGGASPML